MSTMSTMQSLQSLHEALQPLGNLHAESEELGAWIHDSFAALEKLHEELTQWQSELARKETELDLREDAAAAGKPVPPSVAQSQQAKELQRELATAQAKAQEFQTELATAHQRIKQLEAAQRDRKAAGDTPWQDQFAALRKLLEENFEHITRQLDSLQSEEPTGSAAGAQSKSDELRRRAQSRRAAKNNGN